MPSSYDHPNVRPHPRINITPRPATPSAPSAWSPYAFEVNRPSTGADPWGNNGQELFLSPDTPLDPRLSVPARPRSRAVSAYELEATSAPVSSSDSRVYRSSSRKSTLKARHRASQSDLGPGPYPGPSSPTRSLSIASSEVEFSPQLTPLTSVDSLSVELSNLTLDAEEGIRRFQAGELPESDREWHRLVPPEARDALGKKEVHRQSVIFEIIKTEADYVESLRMISEVWIQPLLNAAPPVVPRDRLRGFVKEVFYNLDEILAHHQRMLGALYKRQGEQHPILQSVADIVLDACLLFRNEYEMYIKHYPLAEGRYRSELRRNPAYAQFMSQTSSDPRTSKRDLLDFLSRPITRLPRLRLLLQQVLKYSELDHPDQESIPLILGILTDFIKSTEPGIEAANNKVQFWSLCESLIYFKGEIVDMDLYDESRSLIHQGILARRPKDLGLSNEFHDLFVALLDNYLLLTREDVHHGTARHLIISRPIPLEYLRLGSFNDVAESRKERSEEGGLLEALRPSYRPVYPFTVYHASSKHSRRYTLYANSESSRRRWHSALVDALGIRRARQEANMWFAPLTLHDGFFRLISPRIPYNSGTKFTGKATAAASFVSMGRKFLAVGCATGIYISLISKTTPGPFRKVLTCSNPTSMVALEDFNKLIIYHESSLWSYSLEMLARVSQGQTSPQGLEASRQKVGGDRVVLFRIGIFDDRTIIWYATRTLLLQTTLHMLEVVDPGADITRQRRHSSVETLSFRPVFQPFGIPKDSHDITPLAKSLAICTDKATMIYDGKEGALLSMIPDFSNAYGNLPVMNLKGRCDASRPLGVVRCSSQELLVVYDGIGCYITRHGEPGRQAGFLRWETRASTFVHRGDQILLFSSQFIEIRNIHNGRLVQVIEGNDIRLLSSGLKPTGAIVVVMKGDKDDAEGVSERLVELTATSELDTPALSRVSSGEDQSIWDEWDMI
ncbi:hypothetical protein NEOLEDRAFT_1141126 [Neolentinus lepideus HHB14362 ss-1]|uniref:Dbl homology domain-containing protein n=1 Tax=Neolentinus lepideus HHB14362 ss-1 TaxID=1314782 RepID=A0A165NVA3_9AGAM|nr:hypothetical protein NEOLEDRAFT_1141126 [Neolentinus lepideus HHB14362 ss-1]